MQMQETVYILLNQILGAHISEEVFIGKFKFYIQRGIVRLLKEITSFTTTVITTGSFYCGAQEMV